MDECEDEDVMSGLLFENEMNEECTEEVVENDEHEDLFEPCEPRRKKFKTTYCNPISKAKAHEIYQNSGKLIKSVKTPLLVFPQQVLRKTIQDLIDEVKVDMKLPYNFNEVQLEALHAIGNGQDVFVNSPCGSGKMNIFFAGVLLLRKVKNMPKGVGIILEPLVAISEENRKKNPPFPVMFLDRKGNCKISENFNFSLDFAKEVEDGNIPFVFMSAEALLSGKGIQLLKRWRKNLVMGAIDEGQLYTVDQWGSSEFRVDMSRAPGQSTYNLDAT